jgi:peroxiredoxin
MRCALALLPVLFGCLLSVSQATEPASEEAVEKFKALREEFTKREQEFRKQSENLDDDQRDKLYLQLYPTNSMVEDFQELERAERGNRVGLSCLNQLVRDSIPLGFNDAPVSVAKQKALVLLRDHYLNHPDLDLILKQVNSSHYAGAFHARETIQLLEAARKSPHRNVRCAALYYLAEHFYLGADLAQTREALRSLLTENKDKLPNDHYLASNDQFLTKLKSIDERVDAEAARQRAIGLLEEIRSVYPDVSLTSRDWNDPVLIADDRDNEDEAVSRAGQRADQMMFVLQNLVIGRQAPDINQPDAFGNPLKLHDFRGKVTVLFFSFKGCGPCEAMYPDNRKLIEEMKGRPFAFLGVMGDREIETTREVVESGKITWPVWWAGPERELSNRWNVNAWPEVYVIDHTGIIRYKGTRHELLSLAVQELVEEAEAAE